MVRRRAIDVCQADISHTGGISELMRIASYAETYGITMAPHNPYGPVAMAASVHAAAAMPNFLILEHARFQPMFNDVQTHPLSFKAGHIEIAELEARPGLGIELNMEIVRKHKRAYRPLPSRAKRRDDNSAELF